MIDLIKRLEEKGHTYMAGGNLYFDVSTFPDYGKLACLNLDDLKAGQQAALGEVCVLLNPLLEESGQQAAKKVVITPKRAAARVGRNDPCPCGSGKKYKKCCGKGLV